MTGAMYAAISGLKSHMDKLNVIGNNIANVNTVGYKTGRVVFSTQLYTTMRTGSNGTSVTGGRNPAQVGYGAQIGSIDLDMSSGTYTPTGRGLDSMIDGDGFYLVGDKETMNSIDPKDPETLKALTLTRVGRFEFGADGYLTDGAGNVVYGFLNKGPDKDGKPQICDQLVPIRYPGFAIEKKDGVDVPTIKYPTQTDHGPLENAAKGDTDNKVEYPFAQFDSVSIDGVTGKITGTSKDTDEIITIGYLAIGNVTNPNGVTQESGSYYRAGDGAGALTISVLGGAAKDLGIKRVNGSRLENTGAGPDGDTLPEGTLITSAGTTKLITGGLEMSKTDLATEISEMITTQRGYQANTRIITVTDSMLEELVNIKR